MKGGLGRFMSWPKSGNALIFSILPRMCPESRLSRGSKIMALLYCFPEIHLRLSMHYCPNGAFPSAGSGWEQAHTDKIV